MSAIVHLRTWSITREAWDAAGGDSAFAFRTAFEISLGVVAWDDTRLNAEKYHYGTLVSEFLAVYGEIVEVTETLAVEMGVDDD